MAYPENTEDLRPSAVGQEDFLTLGLFAAQLH